MNAERANRYLVLLFALSICMVGCKSGGDDDGSEGSGTEEQERPVHAERPAFCGNACMTSAPSADRYPRLIITWVYLGDNDVVKLWNLSGVEINLGGYYLCADTVCEVLPDYPLADHEYVTIRLATVGVAPAGTIILGNREQTLGMAGEVAVFASNDFQSASQIRAYVRWGTEASGETFESLAIDQELWLPGQFLGHCDDDRAGFYAVGRVDRAHGFYWGREECFE